MIGGVGVVWGLDGTMCSMGQASQNAAHMLKTMSASGSDGKPSAPVCVLCASSHARSLAALLPYVQPESDIGCSNPYRSTYVQPSAEAEAALQVGRVGYHVVLCSSLWRG